jgi:hypothetical protein
MSSDNAMLDKLKMRADQADQIIAKLKTQLDNIREFHGNENLRQFLLFTSELKPFPSLENYIVPVLHLLSIFSFFLSFQSKTFAVKKRRE